MRRGKTKKRCDICYSSVVHGKYDVFRNDIKNGAKYQIFECNNCGFCFAKGTFSNELLEKIYNNHFYLTSQQNSYHKDSPILLNAEKRARGLKRYIEQGSLLDIGAGKGYFVEAVSSFLEAEGIDLSKFATESATDEGRNIYYGDFMTYKFNKKFDAICLWDAFACFPNPVAVIKRINRILNPNGLLVMTLPMIDSTLAKLFGKRWPLMIPPTNMTFFTTKSAKLLLENNGFEIIKMSYEFKWLTIDFIIKKFLRSIGLYKLSEKTTFFPKKLKIPFKSNDILTIIAKKR